MFVFIVGIIVSLIGLVALCVVKLNWVKLPAAIALLIGVIMVVTSFFSTVPTGYTGVLTTFGRVEDKTVSAGLNVILPWQRIVKMDNRTQKWDITASAFSSDIQQVDITMSFNLYIDPSMATYIYKTIGENYVKKVVNPRVFENTKAVFSKYTAENLIINRDKLSAEILTRLQTDCEEYGIMISDVAITDIDFTDAFTNAVEDKQVAQQNKLAAETKQSQLVMEQEALAKREIIAANAEAEKSIIAANAELEVVKVQAEAALYAGEKEAEMNKRISEALTPSLVDYYWIKQWNGALPSYYGGEATTPVIDLR